jgi:replicative DNA helicase
LEQDADVVIFIHRPEEYEKVSLDQKAEAEIIVAKNRSGAAGTAFMSWVGEYTVFRNNRVEEPI